MSDQERLRAYTASIFIISLLSEYGRFEKYRAFAKVNNILIKKNSIFQEQINSYKIGKRKSISDKAQLFARAIEYSIVSWKETITNSDSSLSITAGNTIANLFRLNKEPLVKIYGLNEDDFIFINKHSDAGVTFNSCKVARILTDHMLELIDNDSKVLDAN